MKKPPRLRLLGFAVAALLALVCSVGLVACQNVATYTQPTVVRVIDGSYKAPAVNVNLDGSLFAANIGQGAITPYAILPAKVGALITVTPAAGGAPLLSANGSFLAGQQRSILITDNVLTPGAYNIAFLDDQRTAAATGQSAFRFINLGLKAGPADIYIVPRGVTLANAIPVVTNLAPGAVSGYVSFPSQSVNLIITAPGDTTARYTSPAINLTGGEVRTVLIMDTKLTTSPPVTVFIGSDVN